VVFEDDDMAVVCKPAGMPTHPTYGAFVSAEDGERGTRASRGATVRSVLPFVLQPSARGTPGVLRRPTHVHRLDKPTSGLVVAAKTRPALQALSRAFADREVRPRAGEETCATRLLAGCHSIIVAALSPAAR
jgi:23S rRNA pseudouridine1911/1915/1917 synthase